MPVGTVKWYDVERGFGFVSNPGEDDCFVGKQVLPKGVTELHQGQRIEFDFAAGRKGPQALRVKVLDAPRRRPQHTHKPEELNGIISDMVTMLEGTIQPALLKGHYPDRKVGEQVAKILRAVAKELEA